MINNCIKTIAYWLFRKRQCVPSKFTC